MTLDAYQWRERLGDERGRTLPEMVAVLITIIEHDVATLHTAQRASAFDTFLEATGCDITDDLRELLPTLFPDITDELERVLGERRSR